MAYQTQLLDWPAHKNTALSLLNDGHCIAVPTETVFGLAADASNPEAVKRIFAAKGRPSNHPLIVHIAGADCIARWADNVPETAYRLAEAFWPGPLSLLLPKRADVNDVVTGGRPTIVLRAPSHPVFRELLSDSGLGLAAPSANRFKTISPTSASHVMRTLSGRIAAVIDAADVEHGIESTIVDLTLTVPQILRPGPISAQQISEVLGCEVMFPDGDNAAAPGNIKKHYQPDTPTNMVTTAFLYDLAKRNLTSSTGVLIYSDDAASLDWQSAQVIRLPASSNGYAQGLYAALHQLDLSGVSEIVVEQPPVDEAWRAVNDRLQRAVA